MLLFTFENIFYILKVRPYPVVVANSGAVCGCCRIYKKIPFGRFGVNRCKRQCNRMCLKLQSKDRLDRAFANNVCNHPRDMCSVQKRGTFNTEDGRGLVAKNWKIKNTTIDCVRLFLFHMCLWANITSVIALNIYTTILASTDFSVIEISL